MPEIDLITGFLGAGKTTFIARYAEWLNRQNIRFAVIENEFGAAGVDSMLLSEQFGNVHELAGGCICCTLKSGFFHLLEQLLPHCDRVLVEPSGLYNLDDFFEVADGIAHNGLGQIGMCLTLVDPHTLPVMTETECSVLRDELEGTGGVVWTKTDEEPCCNLAEAQAFLEQMGNRGEDMPLRVYETPSHALCDEDFVRLQQMKPVRRRHQRVLRDHRMMYQSTSLRLQGIFDTDGLLHFLEHIIDTGECGEIVRVKGFVNGSSGSLAVNCTVSDRFIQECSERLPMLNIIGHQLDRAKIKRLLEALGSEKHI
ncbi:CobW family GTP-binding protein [Butyricicoccus sp.]|uniref:CobW family GTP-binding protein n=1 Tax=Butyricicoccus sp. TaxID=2049021 RepID=UPI003F16291A